MDQGALYSSKLVWVFLFLVLYWAFCIFWAVRGSRLSGNTAIGFFLADRDLSPWSYIMAAAATSFSGWLFINQPALILRDGFPAGYMAFAAITIPLVGALIAKRQWLLAKRFNFVSPGEMFTAYFNNRLVAVFTVIVSLLFAIPFLGLLLKPAGQMLSITTDGAISPLLGMWSTAALLLICTTLGGMNAIARVGPMQSILIIAGAVLLGMAAFHLLGGFEELNRALAKIAGSSEPRWGSTGGHGGGDLNGQFAIAGVAQWTAGLGVEMPQGGPWTSAMILSFVIALAGIQTSPALSMLTFSSRKAGAFAPQQVWASAGAMGIAFAYFLPLVAVGGLLLGADQKVVDAGLQIANLLPSIADTEPGSIIALQTSLIGEYLPWLTGVLAVCVLVGMVACCSSFMAAAGTAVTRDLFMSFFQSEADQRLQITFSRIIMLITTVLALLLATFAVEESIAFGSATLTLSIQLLPAFLAVTWIPWFTRRGINAGLVVGALVAIGLDPLGQYITGGRLPWGIWPWTIHAAGWGLAVNFAVCILGSAVSQSTSEREHREIFHQYAKEYGTRKRVGKAGIATAWIVTFIWFFFAVGPANVIGNYMFGIPGAGYAEWGFSMPSIWAWQLIWWGIGVLLIWFYSYRLEFSVDVQRPIVPAPENAWLSILQPTGRPADTKSVDNLDYENV